VTDPNADGVYHSGCYSGCSIGLAATDIRRRAIWRWNAGPAQSLNVWIT